MADSCIEENCFVQSQDVFDMTEVGLGNILRLLPKGDLRLLQYCNYSLILSMIAKLCSFFFKDDTSDPCFESIWVL